MKRVLTPETVEPLLRAFPAGSRDLLTAALCAPSFVGKLDAGIERGVGIGIRDLMSSLLPLAQLYALADFRVGAITQGASGALYFGANLEIPRAPLGWTIHAEQSTVMSALVHGEKAIRRLAVTAAPCGHCRQFLNELVQSSKLEILLSNRDPFTLTQLLPQAFGPADLGVPAALLAHGDLQIAKAAGESDIAFQAALDALRRSYSPHTRSPSAVALEAEGHVLVAAPYVENAAYNPSLPPMVAALDRLRFHNATVAAIRKAVLVEVEEPRIEQASNSRDILKAAGSNVELAVFKVRLAAG